MTSRKFGVEIEVSGITMQRAAHALRLVGLNAEAEGYNHTTRTHWKVVTDSSVQGGCEIVSPVLQGSAGLEQVAAAVTALDDAGAKINRTCGLHVHFDATGLNVQDIKNVVSRYARFEQEIDRCMPPSRRGDSNGYCKSIRSFAGSRGFRAAQTIADLAGAQDGRYFKLNLQSFHRHGTIEFRQHSGTVNAAKTLNWVRFLDAFIEASRNAPAETPAPATTAATFTGKTAKLLALIATGAGIEDLMQALNWQRHTVRAAVSRIRQAGIQVNTSRRAGQTFYATRGQAASQPPARQDSVFRNVDNDVQAYYRRRAAVLAA
ncbi:MAG: hypothetical protein PWQ57_926 [Desulfovibrionales bacterium]|nr:hypothetical protein [Desulfovibrionales bacterium]